MSFPSVFLCKWGQNIAWCARYIMSERKKDMLTGLEDNILSSEWVLVIATDCYFQKKKNVEIILFSLLFSSCSQLCYGHKEMIKMDWHKVGLRVSFRDRFRVMFSALSTLIGSVLHFENSNKRVKNIRKHNFFLMKLSVLVWTLSLICMKSLNCAVGRKQIEKREKMSMFLATLDGNKKPPKC